VTQTYDELTGAKGREVNFRAERTPARSVFAGTAPLVKVGTLTCGLIDLSVSGLAVKSSVHCSSDLSIGEEVPITVSENGHTLLISRGRIARTEAVAGGDKIGISLSGEGLDIQALKAAHLRAAVTSEKKYSLGELRAHVPTAYRAFIADLQYLLCSYKGSIKDYIERIDPTEEEIEDFLQTCEERAIPEWRSLCFEGNKLAGQMLDPQVFQWCKTFTEAVITSETIVSPLQQRAYEKPLGYPGDYKVMDYVYEWTREGEDPYAQFVHRLALEPMRCVQTRLKTLQDIILSELKNAPRNKSFRLTNLACGTAQEIRNILVDGQFKTPMDIALIDQEKKTLSFAYERTFPLVQQLKGLVRLKYLNTSFKELMRPGKLFEGLGRQNLIYSLGLFDYLKEKRGKALVRGLYEHLEPGGLLVIANLKEGGISKWTSEFMSNWPMIYRTKDEMLTLGENLHGAELSIKTDSLGEVLFLMVRKKSVAG